MGHGHHIEIKQETFVVPAKGKQFAMILMILGLILAGIGIANIDRNAGAHDEHAKVEAKSHDSHEAATAHNEHVEHAVAAESHEADAHAEHANVPNEKFGPRMEYHPIEHPWQTKIWANLLIAGYFFLMVSLCALFWIAIQYAANAGWSAAVKRIPEAMFTFVPVAFGVLLISVIIAKNDLYHWAHYEHLHLKVGDAGYDKILDGKSGFLNSTLFFVLPIVLVTIWYILGRRLRSLSLQEDSAAKGDTTFFKKSIRTSAILAVIFGFTISFMAWFFIMSIDAHWYSTIFGVYNFITHWVTAITIIALLTAYLKKLGYLNIVSDEHIHDLGKFMFAFTIFWAYIWLSQYLLIWYAQIPEEMYYYQIRFEEYKANFLGNLVMNFCLPFALLLMRSAKRNRWVLGIIGTIMILGHYHDVWFMVMPGVFGPGMQIGVLEVGVFMFFAGLFLIWTLTALTKRGLIPVNHPYIEESAHHDVGV